MSYVTPITDRTAADIAALNSKAYWNVADWTRVYGNSQLVNSLAAIMLDDVIAFTLLSTPTTTTIPSVTDFNNFLTNIETVRLAVAGEAISGTTTSIKDDYVAGVGQEAPDYIDANLWESTLDAIWDHWSGDSLEVCPTLTTDVTVSTLKIYVDCVDMADFNITINGTDILAII